MIKINFLKKRRRYSALQRMTSLLWVMGLVLVASVALLLATGCSFHRPATETPVSKPTKTNKSFFVDMVTENVVAEDPVYDSKGRLVKAAKHRARVVQRPKTFLCGMAPINETGHYSELITHGVHMMGHCNVEFEITETALIGRLVNPTFPNDRNRWKQAFLIPIKRHYYYERAKDSYGRETNEYVEREDRSDWSARPNMELDVANIRILDYSMAPLFGPDMTTRTTDIEWDVDRGYLAFTTDVISQLVGSEYQGRFRFNFLRFEHNPNFVRTPYSSQNAQYLNALHLLGEVEEGEKPILYAARWDMTKSHTIYTHGMPEAVRPIAKAVVDAWNDVFEKELKLPRAFRLSFDPVNKYGFDLRYPSMTWVEDKETSLRSPLGIGMALADVRNGEILWGNITMYGGFLERYIKSYLPTQGEGGAVNFGKGQPIQVAPLGGGFFSFPQQMFAPPELRRFDGATAAPALARGLSKNLSLQIAEGLADKSKASDQASPVDAQARAEVLAHQIVSEAKKWSDDISTRAPEMSARHSIPELLKFPTAEQSAKEQLFGKLYDKMTPPELASKLQAKSLGEAKHASGGVVFDVDRRFMDVAPGWAAAIQQSKVDYDKVYEVVVKELIVHEFGHMLGLGHQFKENILPVQGMVPPKYYKELAEAAKTMTNATSVMGYKHPMTEVMEVQSIGSADGIKPGGQDILALQYLYNRKYPTYRPNSGEEAFRFVDLPANGVIPARDPKNPEYLTSFFPQCNDYHASLSVDPYCNRFDRGYNAETIVKSYFDDLNSNLISTIYPFADVRGGNSEAAEGYLWYQSLKTMGRIRLFYDYMRQKYADQINQFANNQKDLFEFSRVCSREIEPSSNAMANLFWKDGDRSKETELGQLCRVNRHAIQEYTNFLINPGPDYTDMDWDNNYSPASMTGGDARPDESRAFGTRTALSVLPLKYSAFNALTTTRPYFLWGPWTVPVHRYSDQKGLFSYATLYPYEYTQAMAATVEKNLRFSSGKPGETTSMGLSVLSMGYFLDQLNGSNDTTRFPREYLDRIRTQSNFRISMVAVLMGMKGREESSDSGVMRVTHFQADLFDFRAGKFIEGSEAYMLPGGRVIVRGPNRSFVFPITKFSFLDDRTGLVLAYRVEYDDEHDDVLASHSVKTSFEKMHKSVIDSCLIGQNDGLSSYFSSQIKEFEGFEALSGVSRDKEMQILFLKSVEDRFAKYKETRSATGLARCEESLKGLGLIVSSAAVVNGYLLPETFDYIVK